MLRPDEAAYILARLLVEIGHLLREAMHSAMDVGVDIAVKLVHPLDNAQGLLRSGPAVEIRQRLAVHLAVENGKIPAYVVYVEHGYNRSSLSVNTSASAPPITSSADTMSHTKPSICNRRACASDRPR